MNGDWNLSYKLKTSTDGDTGVAPGGGVEIARRQ